MAWDISRQYTPKNDILELMAGKSENTDVSDGRKSVETDASAPLGVILATIGDTTWRMFVPSVGCTLLGVWLDSMLSTKPWLMVVGIIFGVAAAAMLVHRQIYGIRHQEARK